MTLTKDVEVLRNIPLFAKVEPAKLKLMAFAAGAMLYVVVEELLPETTRQGNTDVATLGFLSGFLVMMAMDTALG